MHSALIELLQSLHVEFGHDERVTVAHSAVTFTSHRIICVHLDAIPSVPGLARECIRRARVEIALGQRLKLLVQLLQLHLGRARPVVQIRVTELVNGFLQVGLLHGIRNALVAHHPLVRLPKRTYTFGQIKIPFLPNRIKLAMRNFCSYRYCAMRLCTYLE